MSATSEEIETESYPEHIGIIAGGGGLPERLLHACEQKGIDVFVVAFEGQTDPLVVKGQKHIWTRLGAAGQIINTLKSHEIYDIVLIGSLRRPSLSELLPDLKTVEFFAKIGIKALGDNDLLSIIRQTLEEEGFKIHGVHKFVDDLLAPFGLIGRYKPSKADWIDIKRGLQISQELGAKDVGQSVIVQEGIVLGVEAVEGTDELIQRCKHLKRKGRKGVLVKTCKPQQDHDFDLPTIGSETIKHAYNNDLAGVVIHAGLSLLIDPQKVAEIADHHKMFVIGVDPLKEI
ncbi:MAG: UDP-2,3-diacylglucosamine diphosphatase LpxI [Alphaproteobacteria bacterium]|nr:UDP-2,3-diacylglucosamine diphosphatase LpxI [Alphaproteobacteria bacterium]